MIGVPALFLVRYFNGGENPDGTTQAILAEIFHKNPKDIFPDFTG
jgi:hypothetical protein